MIENYKTLLIEEMGNPEISVITAVFNRESFIERAIESLLNQSFTDWELVAVDDGSTDKSLQILKSYQSKFKNITIIAKEHKDLSSSRNTGLKYSRGKYITFLDSDDEYRPAHLEKRYGFMTNNPAIDLIHGGVKVVGNNFVRDKLNPELWISISDCIVGATLFGKTEVFKSLHGFRNLEYAEDSEFFERAKLLFNVVKINFETYVYHRDVPDSITNNYAG